MVVAAEAAVAAAATNADVVAALDVMLEVLWVAALDVKVVVV